MEVVNIKEGMLLIQTFSDGVRGRFDSRDNETLYVELLDFHGVFYSKKLVGTLQSMNKELKKFEIELQMTS